MSTTGIPTRAERLEETLKDLNKRWDNHVAIDYGANHINEKIDPISTGSLLLDKLTGVGGFPKGRITELYGWEDSAKSTVCFHHVAEAQKIGVVAYIDMEHRVSKEWAIANGVNWDELLYSNPDFGEEALEVIERLIESGQIASIIVDSVAALVPKKEIEDEHGDGNFGLQAKMMSAGMRKINRLMKESRCCLVFINQNRVGIGKFTPSPTMTPETQSGGTALPFYASLRLRLSAEKSKAAIKVTARNKKNTIGGRYGDKTIFAIGYDGKIDTLAEIAQIVVDDKLVEVKGGGNIYFQEKHWRGLDKFTEELRSNKELYETIYGLVKK